MTHPDYAEFDLLVERLRDGDLTAEEQTHLQELLKKDS